MVDIVNIANTQPDANNYLRIVEVNAPKLPSGVNDSLTTVPSLGQGIVNGTIVAKLNNDLVHVCDFSNKLKKDSALKEFILAGYQAIQEAIRSVMRFLGLSDPSGTMASTAVWLRGLAAELRKIKVEYLDPINNFADKVLGFVTWAKAMILWIQSLPARFYALLEGCLLQLLNWIKNILVDSFQQIENPFTDVVAATKELTGEVVQTINSVNTTVGKVQATASVINTTLNNNSSKAQSSLSPAMQAVSTPTTPSTVNTANSYVSLLTSSLPTASNVSTQNTQSNDSKKSAP